MVVSRFSGHYLLHGRGTPDDVSKLASIMAQKFKVDESAFKVPQPPYAFKEDASAAVSYHWLRTYFLPDTLINSVIFGFGLGGLLAAKLQEEFPARNLSVVTINSPTSEDVASEDVASEGVVLDGKVQGRVALYSSSYRDIAFNCNWPQFAPQAYDVSWLRNGIKNTKYGLAYLMSAYMRHEDISGGVTSFSDETFPDLNVSQETLKAGTTG